jgi:hypothetical protein
MLTTVALVAVADRPLAGCIAFLKSAGVLFTGITNGDGYLAFANVGMPFTGTLQLAGACQYYEQPIVVNAVNVTLRVGSWPPSPPNPQDLQLPACVPFRRPFQIAPRIWKGNMCGVRVPGLAPVAGGAADASLVLSWFYDRYDLRGRALILERWLPRYPDVLLSWPDSRAFGQTPRQFRATCDELITVGARPCVFLTSKDFDPRDDAAAILARLEEVLPLLIGVVPRVCIGWELNLFLGATPLQTLIDAIAPRFTPSGCRVYVHFSEGVSAWQQPGASFGDFWRANVGKLTGVLRQKILAQSPADYRDGDGGIRDVLERFAGFDNCPSDSGFGHPFDDIELEISAMLQFNGQCTEAEGDRLGRWAIDTPGVVGPLGLVRVMGSGNGS